MIGVFDSGVGGLTVVREIFKKLPDYKIVYFGDTARTPYGTKSKETIIKYAREDAKFLLDHGAKIIVIACNTASAVAAEILRKELNVPVFEVIMPAVQAALSVTKRGNVGVIGTRATITSGVYELMIKNSNKNIQVESQPCPLLVPLVEEAWLNQPETKKIVKKYLQPFKNKQIDTLILGCTHYPVLKNIIKARVGRKVKLVDSAEEVVHELKKFLAKNDSVEKSLIKDGDHKFFVSDLTAQVPKIAEKLLGKTVKFEKVEVG
ncbi:MAG: glutamate racemase [Patescibacteria group bacterium]|jgi:glutamate racemase